PVSGDASLSTAPVKLTGEDATNYAGYSVLMPGDFDGDGNPDLIIGAYGADGGTTSAAGVTYILNSWE
ncbi:MAG: integrin alpha, partial [Myxococcota bacterium]